MSYYVESTIITVVDGVEVDITVRDAGGGERKVDQVGMDLKERLGVLQTAYQTETPPDELTEIPSENTPPMTVAWGRLFADGETDQ